MSVQSKIPSVLATIDLGSNSFRLAMARIEHGQLVQTDYYKEPVRLGAGLDERGFLTDESIARSVACLQRFAERLRGLPPQAVRAVATQSLRSAKNPEAFLGPAQAALGYPIEIIGGQEEARLIYKGVAHDLPKDDVPRLVADIGGGSTELILGTNWDAHDMESLRIGCVSHTLKFFPDGIPSKRSFEKAVMAATAKFEEAFARFNATRWQYAVGSSGTIEAIAELCDTLDIAAPDPIYPITRERMVHLASMLYGKEPKKWGFGELKEQRAQVFAGGLAVLMGLFYALNITAMRPCYSALRQGVMMDLHEALSPVLPHEQASNPSRRDTHTTSIERVMKRFGVELSQAMRVRDLAVQLYAQVCPDASALARNRLAWAALTHEIGMSVSHEGYHKHGAYLMANTDLAGFSRFGQRYLADLIGGQVGGLRKWQSLLTDSQGQYADFLAHIVCLRLAVILAHARVDIALPQAKLRLDMTRNGLAHIVWDIEQQWCTQHPLSAYLIEEEWRAWSKVNVAAVHFV